MLSDLDTLGMIKEVFRFFAVTLVIVSGLIGSWYLLKIQSEKQIHKTQPPEVVRQAIVSSPISVSAESQSGSRYIETIYKNQNWSLAESPDRLLTDVLRESKSPLVVLRVLDNDPRGLALLKAELERWDLWQNLIVLSKSDKLLKDMRELAPRWAYSTGEVFLARYLSFSSLGLSGLLEVPGDAIFISNRRQLIGNEKKDIVRFAKERGTVVIFDTLNASGTPMANSIYITP